MQRRKSMVVSTPSPRERRNSLRATANFYAITAEKATQGLLDLGIDPAFEAARKSKSSIESGDPSLHRVPRTESARAGGGLIIPEHDIQTALYGLLQRDRRVSWVSRMNSGKFRLQGSPGGPDRWFSANTMPGMSDLLGCLISDGTHNGRIVPGRMFAFEVKEGSLAARREVARVIEAVDAGSFDPIEASDSAGRIASQYGFLLKVRRSGGVGMFVFDVDEAMKSLIG